jgi:hypothetical protein
MKLALDRLSDLRDPQGDAVSLIDAGGGPVIVVLATDHVAREAAATGEGLRAELRGLGASLVLGDPGGYWRIHDPMEPHATTAVWQGDRVTVYDSTQGISRVRDRLAGAFGLATADVRVISAFVGGGFGGKGVPWSHVVLAALAARQLGRAVRIVLTRAQMFGPVGGRPATVQTVALGATRAGKLTAIRHDSVSACCRFDEFVERATLPTRGLYATPNLATTERLVELDVGPPANQRGERDLRGADRAGLGGCPAARRRDRAGARRLAGHRHRHVHGDDPDRGRVARPPARPGRLPICGVAAAVANAVYHATGTRLRDLPLALEPR